MRLIVFLLFAAAIWYGWKQGPKLWQRMPAHDAVVENQTGGEIQAIRVRVGGQTLVREQLASEERAVLPFRVTEDASFELTWRMRGEERTWSGGMVPAGPMTQRHVFVVDAEGQILYRPENK